MKYLISILLGVIITGLAALALILYVTPLLYNHRSLLGVHCAFDTNMGTFGDSAGLMNACFSLLAFAAVVVTFVIQNRKDNKNEQLARKSQFENVFFNMTSTFEEIVSHLVYKVQERSVNSIPLQSSLYPSNETESIVTTPQNEKEIHGREIFRYLYLYKPVNDDNGQVVQGLKRLVEVSSDISMEDIRKNFFDGTLDHYFRYAYRIVKYVKTSKLIEDDEREGYASIFRAQLSCFELLILFFNCLEMDENKFKHLVEEFHLFNNIREEYFPEIEPYTTIYSDKVNCEDGSERDGFDEETEKKEYSISAFHKTKDTKIIQRTWLIKQIWEIKLSFSKRHQILDE